MFTLLQRCDAVFSRICARLKNLQVPYLWGFVCEFTPLYHQQSSKLCTPWKYYINLKKKKDFLHRCNVWCQPSDFHIFYSVFCIFITCHISFDIKSSLDFFMHDAYCDNPEDFMQHCVILSNCHWEPVQHAWISEGGRLLVSIRPSEPGSSLWKMVLEARHAEPACQCGGLIVSNSAIVSAAPLQWTIEPGARPTNDNSMEFQIP